VIASWDHAPWCHQPPKLAAVWLDGERIEPGEFDFDLRGLNRTMQELLEAAGLPTANPPEITAEWAGRLERGQAVGSDAPPWVKNYKYDRKKEAVVLRQGPVWHCPVRLHPDDPILTDQQWEYIAERLMKAVGIQQEGCRWIAVRHGDDHIHLMATLVSERTGKRAYPYRDYYKLRDECRALEKEFGLVETPDVDWTASRQPSRKEIGKAQRKGKAETARQELRRVVAQCAAASQSGMEFVAKLKAEGLIVRTRSDSEGTIRGYSVALPGDVTKDGDPVRYSGGALAADLTWPKLMARWETVPAPLPVPRGEDGRLSPGQRRDVLDSATAVVGQATAAVQAAVRGVATGEDVDGIAHAVGEVLSVLSRGQEDRTRGPLAEVSERYDRAARTPHRVLPRRIGPLAGRNASPPLRSCWRWRLWSPRSPPGSSREAVSIKPPPHVALPVRCQAWRSRGRPPAGQAHPGQPNHPLPGDCDTSVRRHDPSNRGSRDRDAGQAEGAL
jgi:hypothetical protein